jgi:hypothetical protein
LWALHRHRRSACCSRTALRRNVIATFFREQNNIAENPWCGAYSSCNFRVELAASRVLLMRGFLK